jgi:hypothetical protein
VTEKDPRWRLRDVHAAMRDRKRDGEPQDAGAVLNVVPLRVAQRAPACGRRPHPARVVARRP